MHIIPPKIPYFFLRLFSKNERIESLTDNLTEEYSIIFLNRGKLIANVWFWQQTLKSIPKLIINSTYWGAEMLKHYLKISLRNIKKRKGYSLINIVGLALGMACCILLFSYISTELSYDTYNTNSNRIYRICSDLKMGDNKLNIPKTSYKLINSLKETYPEIEDIAVFNSLPKTAVLYKNKSFYEDRIYYATNSAFNVFTFPVIKGDKTTPLAAAGSVVITRNLAAKYFGSNNPIGEILKIGDEGEFRITAVIENVPSNSHFQFDVLCSFETLYMRNISSMQNWVFLNHRGYLLLKEVTDYKQFENKFKDLVDSNIGAMLNKFGASFSIYLQPLTDIHLKSHLEQEIQANGDIKYIYIFSAIGFFILLLACINYMNLATARSVKKAKEIGVRKVLGANRKRLIKQFIVESVIFSLLSLILSIMITAATIPLLSSTIGVELTLKHIPLEFLIPSLIAVAVIVGIIAGSYPAFYLSALSPISAIKSNRGKAKGEFKLRGALVVFQFAVSIVLIIATTITIQQLYYMRNSNLGFNKEHVLVLPLHDNRLAQSAQILKNELTQYSSILSAGLSSHVPGETTYKNPYFPEEQLNNEPQWMGQWNIDHDYISTMGIEFADGRNFSPGNTSDQYNAVLINETAVKMFGWTNAVGRTIKALENAKDESYTSFTVIGVIKDFHITSLHQKIEPIIITDKKNGGSNALSLKINPANLTGTMDFIRSRIEEIAPDIPFDYFFLDESFDGQYRNEEMLSSLFSSFTFLAIIIACLGLIGLASYTAENRTKEIGIRKVMGAKISQIILILTKEFIKWVLIANLIAWPIAYILLEKWLGEFAYRTDINYETFIISGAAALLVALITVSYQSIKASLVNPTESLRTE